MTCPHQHDLSKLERPRLSQSVHREECTQCFDNQDTHDGIDVCLVCFNGACLDQDRHHARTHAARSGHAFTLNVKRTLKPTPSRGDDEPPAKMTKLAIVQEREEDKYDHHTTLKCWKCDPAHGRVIVADQDMTRRLTEGVMQSLSSARQSEVKAWEEEIVVCEHALLLEQHASGPIAAEGLAHCASCELTSNLWLCLSCGALGCGRAQYGGVGGNGHALAHFNAMQHPVCVKLGTITPEGGADVYCYACNDARLDPELTTHLAAFGINVSSQQKTEKSMTELQIEQNLTFDFSLTAEDGSALKPVFGPGATGLGNLGNSCYMASVLQTLFSLTPFQDRYYRRPSPGQRHVSEGTLSHWATCGQLLPADCLECQLYKLADGLLSGRYSHPHTEKPPADLLAHAAPEHTPWQMGLKPAGFKALVGKGHAEFATMRQQDAEEFFGHLLIVLRRYNHQARGGALGDEPTEIFSFGLEQRLECLGCRRVRYRVDNMDVLSLGVPATEIENGEGASKSAYAAVPLELCLDLFLGETGQETLEYQCEAGCGKTRAIRRTQLATFPDVLVIHAKKFQLKNWVPTKLDIPILLPEGELVLDKYLGGGLQPGEEALPDGPSAGGAPSLPTFDAETMAQLEEMGFPTVRCQKGLLATGNVGAEAAMEWLFSHMEDPDIDDPIVLGGVAEPSAEQVGLLADMGFTSAQARKALLETGENAERAIEWLFSHPDDTGEDVSSAGAATDTGGKPSVGGSAVVPARYQLKAFISHKGPSVHSGHYVAHIRVPGLRDDADADGNESPWVLFNDEKVVLADGESVRELKTLAYMYVFERV